MNCFWVHTSPVFQKAKPSRRIYNQKVILVFSQKTNKSYNSSHLYIKPLPQTQKQNTENTKMKTKTQTQKPNHLTKSKSPSGFSKIHDSKQNPERISKKKQVFLEGYDEELVRSKSLTDEDLDELKGCLDLGFGGFSYDEIPELCNTLPALELCYSMSDHSPVGKANWKISSPGDDPEDVKARLKFWAQAVACTVKLCS